MIGVGTKLYGFCNGFFGRDSYDTKTVEAMGCDWVVARDEKGVPLLASFRGGREKQMMKHLQAWSENRSAYEPERKES